MYQFTGKLKIFAIALMVIGVVGTVISFSSAPTGSQGEDLLSSYAKVRFDNLEPLTGDVTRIKCYMKNHQAPKDLKTVLWT